MYGIYAMAASGRMQYDYKQTNTSAICLRVSVQIGQVTRKASVNYEFWTSPTARLSASYTPPTLLLFAGTGCNVEALLLEPYEFGSHLPNVLEAVLPAPGKDHDTAPRLAVRTPTAPSLRGLLLGPFPLTCTLPILLHNRP
jgi:hypothetical protein